MVESLMEFPFCILISRWKHELQISAMTSKMTKEKFWKSNFNLAGMFAKLHGDEILQHHLGRFYKNCCKTISTWLRCTVVWSDALTLFGKYLRNHQTLKVKRPSHWRRRKTAIYLNIYSHTSFYQEWKYDITILLQKSFECPALPNQHL